MKCKEDGCDGQIDHSKSLKLRIAYEVLENMYACGTCGRLHWPDGSAVLPQIFLEGDKVISKDKQLQVA